MLLTELISLSTDLSSIDRSVLIPYLQNAYGIIVDNIRLSPNIYPMLIKGDWFAIQKFDYKCIRVLSSSEIAFKEIRDFVRTEFIQDNSFVITDELKTAKPIIGCPSMEYFGFDKVDYDSMNANHSISPVIFNSKQYYNLKNKVDIGNGFCQIIAYQYPYPVHVENTPYETEYRYDIKWMSDTYTFEELIVDDLIGVLMILKANQLFKEDILDLNGAKHFDYLCKELINMFNQNEEFHNNKLTTNGFMRFNT